MSGGMFPYPGGSPPVAGGESVNIIVNGDFADGSTGWGNTASTLNTSSGTGLVTYNEEYGALLQEVTYDPGITYEYSFNVISLSLTGAGAIYCGDGDAWMTTITTTGVKSGEWTPSASASLLTFMSVGTSVGDTIELDNISVRVKQ